MSEAENGPRPDPPGIPGIPSIPAGSFPAPAGGDEPPQPLGVALGLGRAWQPAGCSWSWHKMQTNIGTLHVLRVQTTAGVIGITFSDEDLRKFVALTLEESSGLVVPR